MQIEPVPYRERRTIKKYWQPRLEKRRRFKRRRRFFLFLALLIVVAAAVYLPRQLTFPARFQPAQPPAEEKIAGTTTSTTTTSFLFTVYSTSAGIIRSFAICGYEQEGRSLSILFLDKDIYLPVLGLELQPLGQLSRQFIPAVHYSLKNMFPYELTGPYEVTPEVLNLDALRLKPEEFLARLAEYNPELEEVSRAIDPERVEVIPAPTALSDFGERRVLVLDVDGLKQSAKILFADSFKPRTEKAGVLVLNGSGTPGIALAASFQLIEAGFHIIGVKNADRFGYLTTEVRTTDPELGKEIISVLGTGEISEKAPAETVVQAVIIIGKDFEVAAEKEEEY